MLRSRLFWKLFGAYALLTLVSAAAFVVIVSGRQREAIRNGVRERLRDSAAVLRSDLAPLFPVLGEAPDGSPVSRSEAGPGAREQRVGERSELRDGGVAGLHARLRALQAETGMRLTLIAGDGAVLADSAEDPRQMDNHGRRPEVEQARREGFGVAERNSPTLGIPMMYAALRVGEADAPAGFVRTARDLGAVAEEVAAVERRVWGIAAAIALVALSVTYVAVAHITRPLETLTRAARAMAAGDLGQTLRVDGRDELGDLAGTFNAMSRELAARIEELEQQSRKLEANSQRLSAVLGGMVEGVVAVDDGQRILFANRAARSMLDFSGPSTTGRPLWEVIRNATIQEIVRVALSGGTPEPVEFEVPGTQAVVAMVASRLSGRPCPGVVLVLHDVTELRRLETVRREFVSNASHELKTPLTSIRAYAETLLEGALEDPEHNRLFVQRIDEQAERLHALILDMLRLARVEAGEGAFEVAAIAVEDSVRGALEAHAALAESKPVSLAAEPPPQPVRALADAEGLRTILDNLVDNAIKYTPPGGSVTVRWREDGEAAVIEVADTGTGIPPDHQARIFERFYRVDKARSREVGGTGLGLSIVKHLTQVFGGSVEVASRPGEGSTFTVRLPLAEREGA